AQPARSRLCFCRSWGRSRIGVGDAAGMLRRIMRPQPGKMSGAFCRVGLATSDPVGAKAFYERLLDWQSSDLAAGQFGVYTVLHRGGREVAILYRQTLEA